MSTRIVIIDYVVPARHEDGDMCTGCPRLARKAGSCQHFGQLKLKPKTKSTWLRHPNCIRAEERTQHASHSRVMLASDFLPEDSAVHDKKGDDNDDD